MANDRAQRRFSLKELLAATAYLATTILLVRVGGTQAVGNAYVDDILFVIGAVMAVAGVGVVFGFFVGGRRRIADGTKLSIAVLLMLVSMVVLFSLHRYYVTIALGLIGIGTAIGAYLRGFEGALAVVGATTLLIFLFVLYFALIAFA